MTELLRFRCPECNRKLRIDARWVGRHVTCPQCGAPVNVPAPEAIPEPPPLPSLATPYAAASTAAAPPAKPATSVGLGELLPVRGEADVEHWIDMTAMVDIVFFLLIFFMVTSGNSQQAAIEIPSPQIEQQGSANGRAAKTVATFESDGDCLIVRIDGDDTVWLEDQEIPSLVELSSQLRKLNTPSKPGGDPKYVLVVAAGDARHGTSVEVLDAVRSSGVLDVRLAIEE